MDEAVGEFLAEAREGLEALDGKLVDFERTPGDAALLADIFRLIHSLKGTSGFLGLSRLQAVTHAAENVLGAFRDGELTVDREAVSAVLEVVDAVRLILDALERNGAEPAGDDRALIARLDAIFAGAAAPPASPSSPASPSPSTAGLLARLGGEATLDAACEGAIGRMVGDAEIGPAFAGVDIDRLQAALRETLVATARGAREAGALEAALAAAPFAPPLGAAARARFVATVRAGLLELDAEPAAVEAVLAAPAPPAPPASTTEAAPAPASPEPAGRQTIRVAVDALENLMTTVSELVLIRNQLLQTLRAQPDTPFAASLHRLNQVTSELQEGVMTARMQPIGGAFAKLPRLVRDLAADLGKSIALSLSGEETELDRQVLESIKDPLVHMIRNAADHGLETPAERLAAGKPETGRITLSARHEGGAILVEISDDGRGISPGRVRDKALANGLVTAAQASSMADAEAQRLIFAPGFSTAAAVTAVSGRGVGMDVVRTNIEKIGGVIELNSVEGQGSRFTIRIPLTLSIVSALIVESGGERFALPQSGIVELVSAGGSGARRIEHINGAAVLRLRDRLLPLVSLRALLELGVEAELRPDACIVVAQAGGFAFGVVVDRVFDTEEIVVKPVASVLRQLRIYSGATILGDGSVIMILDVKGVSVEAGASGLMNAEPVPDEGPPPVEIVTEPMLVFQAGAKAPKAARLSEVSRIEELEPRSLEFVDGRSVMQYRGRLVPVLGADGNPAPAETERRRPLLVFALEERNLGLLVDEIIDVMEGAPAAELPASGAGAAGSAIIGGRAVELIDVAWFWRRADGESEPPRHAPAPAPSPSPLGPAKRLLVVDRSPFTQLLLRPLLSQAGYAVEVAAGPDEALRLHDRGEAYDLILADTSRDATAVRLAAAFRRAVGWHATPLLGLGSHRLDPHSGATEFADGLDEVGLLAAVGDTLTRAEAA